MGYIQWQCLCLAKWAISNEQCPKCGKYRSKIQDIDYWIGYRLPNGKKRLEKGGKTVKQAEKILRDREHKMDTGEFVDAKATGYSKLQDLIDAYLRYVEVDKPGFLSLAKQYTSEMILRFGNPKWQSITAEQIDAWRLNLRSEGRAEATVNNYLKCGAAMFARCLPQMPNPWKAVKLYKVKNQLVRFLTNEQEQRVLTYASEHYPWLFEILVIAVATGMRRGNVVKLKRSQVHWDMGIIQVIQKGGKIHQAVLTDDCRRILSAIPDNGTEFFWAPGHNGFTKSETRLDNCYKECISAAGVNSKEFRFHDLRHHGATKVVKDFGLLAAKEFLGHSSITHTLRYAHLEQKAHAANINSIPIQIPEGLQDKVLPIRKVG
jgi:integrase